jgi:hypothetical protein
MKRILLVLLLLVDLNSRAQDLIFFNSGIKKTGRLSRISDEHVWFEYADSIGVRRVPRRKLLLLETADGKRYVFSGFVEDTPNIKETMHTNYLGLQPTDIFFGRATAVYEKYDELHHLSFAFPFSLVFDPFGNLYPLRKDSLRFTIPHNNTLSFVGGAEVLYYPQKRGLFRFFVGPRLRYGHSFFIQHIEAWTLQTQAGWKIQDRNSRFAQHISVGYGFVRVLSSRAGTLIDARQSYWWFSFNYRLGFRL